MSISRFAARFPRMGLILSAMLLMASLAGMAMYGLGRPVSFDGAMNLQVAQSLAEGEGYVRSYGGVRPFPEEVQTNAPYVIPAAVVFAMAGTGIVQAQAVNYAYMLGWLLLVAFVVARFKGPVAGMLSAIALMATPGFYWIGFNGWGELVALFWWGIGTYLMLAQPRPWMRALGAVALGLALATKTVILIGVAATMLAYGIWLLAEARERGFASGASRLALAACCVMLPLAFVELWRIHSLGGMAAYLAWWKPQVGAIVFQAGVSGGPGVAMTQKVSLHFQVLALQTRLPAWLLGLWLSLPLAWSVAAFMRDRPWRSAGGRLWATVFLVVAVYLVWYLAITPDTHVRLRRIEIGLILVQCLWLFCIGWCSTRLREGWLRWLALASVLVFAVVLALFANDAIFDMRRGWRPDLSTFEDTTARIRALPADAPMFGKGFLSAPVLALYAERDFDNIDRYTSDDLARIGTGYIVVDSLLAKDGRFAPELLRYPSVPVVEARGFKVYRLDFTHPEDPFRAVPATARTLPWVDFSTGRYPFVFGLQPPMRNGSSWARSDVEILLEYPGSRDVLLVAYRPKAAYARGEKLTLSASLDGCALGSRTLLAGKHDLRFAVPGGCGLEPGQNVRLRIRSDNMLPSDIRNMRQLSYVVLAAGFHD
jgi:hypothetical protein